jgi:hypothetical protein
MNESSAKCTVTRAHILSLIEAVVYTLGSDEYRAIADDDHYRRLVSQQVEAAFLLAEEIDFDLWSEVAEPVGCDEYKPIAVWLREADAMFGMPTVCAVPQCSETPVPCCRRPRSLPRGTRWPSCPELCAAHSAMRCKILGESARRELPQHSGPSRCAGDPLKLVRVIYPTVCFVNRDGGYARGLP